MKFIQEKDKKVAEFVTGLPAELRRKLRPPLPPTLNQLSPKVNKYFLIILFNIGNLIQSINQAKEKIEAIFDDEKMSDQERQAKVSQLISSLPPEQKMIVQDAFGQQIIQTFPQYLLIDKNSVLKTRFDTNCILLHCTKYSFRAHNKVYFRISLSFQFMPKHKNLDQYLIGKV